MKINDKRLRAPFGSPKKRLSDPFESINAFSTSHGLSEHITILRPPRLPHLSFFSLRHHRMAVRVLLLWKDTLEYAAANLFLRPPHVIPFPLPLSTGPPSTVLPHNSLTPHPCISYTYFPPTPGASAFQAAIETGL
jgi:hypothetical protein